MLEYFSEFGFLNRISLITYLIGDFKDCGYAKDIDGKFKKIVFNNSTRQFYWMEKNAWQTKKI